MTPLEQAVEYAEHDQVPVFPCRAKDEGDKKKRKSPYTGRGFYDASRDPKVITSLWKRWPDALIGMPTGKVSKRWVLDIDVKDETANGFDTLEDLGHSILPYTPIAHTHSGGFHVYLDAGERELRSNTGLIGPGLDVRGDGGYVILPSEGSGYSWDPLWNFDTVAPAAAPDWLWPPKLSVPPPQTYPIRAVEGLDRYGEAAVNGACNAIARAPQGYQEATLNSECFSIGTLVGAKAIPQALALRALLRAAAAMPSYNPRLPWRPEELDLKVRCAFEAGVRRPRGARHAAA